MRVDEQDLTRQPQCHVIAKTKPLIKQGYFTEGRRRLPKDHESLQKFTDF
jgi:hypothetical protein